jgi:hypothetical protein
MHLRTVAIASLAVLASLGACSSGSDGPQDSGPAVTDADEGIDGVLAIRIPSAKHVEGEVDYDRDPPAGGDHNPVPARCGFYDEELPPEFVVHSLEHGAVWLAYGPDLDEASTTLIHDLVRDNPETIATVHPGLEPDVAVVATAWARQLSLPAADDPRLAEFVEQYQDGDQSPEASVDCAGQGVGVPLP